MVVAALIVLSLFIPAINSSPIIIDEGINYDTLASKESFQTQFGVLSADDYALSPFYRLSSAFPEKKKKLEHMERRTQDNPHECTNMVFNLEPACYQQIASNFNCNFTSSDIICHPKELRSQFDFSSEENSQNQGFEAQISTQCLMLLKPYLDSCMTTLVIELSSGSSLTGFAFKDGVPGKFINFTNLVIDGPQTLDDVFSVISAVMTRSPVLKTLTIGKNSDRTSPYCDYKTTIPITSWKTGDAIPDTVKKTLTSLTLNNVMSLTDLSEAEFYTLPQLDELYIHCTGIKSLSQSDFQGLTATQLAICTNLELTSIDSDTLNYTSQSLTFFELFRNPKLTSISPDFLHPLTQAETLSIFEMDNLQGFDTDQFKGLSKVTSLNLGQNPFVTFPDRLFDPMPNLEFVYLYNNSFATFSREWTQGWSNVKWLAAANNQYLTSIQDGAFTSMKNVEFIGIFNCKITSLPAGTFMDQGSLTTLDIHENPLAPTTLIIDPNTTTSIEILDLSGTLITNISLSTSHSFTKLKFLNVSNCPNIQLHESFFSTPAQTPTLEVLDVSGTGVLLPKTVCHEAPVLRYLFARSMKDRHFLNKEFFHYCLTETVDNTQLTYLDISDNDLDRLDYYQQFLSSYLFYLNDPYHENDLTPLILVMADNPVTCNIGPGLSTTTLSDNRLTYYVVYTLQFSCNCASGFHQVAHEDDREDLQILCKKERIFSQRTQNAFIFTTMITLAATVIALIVGIVCIVRRYQDKADSEMQLDTSGELEPLSGRMSWARVRNRGNADFVAKGFHCRATKINKAEKEYRKFRSEVYKMKGLSHRCLVPVEGCTRSTSSYTFYYVMPLEGVGVHLGQFLEIRPDVHNESSSRDIPAMTKYQICLDIAEGLKYLHSQNVYHGNLTESNIVIVPESENSSLEAKLINYRYAIQDNRYNRRRDYLQFRFMPVYAAPELLAEANVANIALSTTKWKQADVYTLGLLTYAIFTQRYPNTLAFQSKTPIEFTRESRNWFLRSSFEFVRDHPLKINFLSNVPKSNSYPDFTKRDIEAIQALCMNESPTRRPTASDVVDVFQPLSSGMGIRSRSRRASMSRYGARHHKDGCTFFCCGRSSSSAPSSEDLALLQSVN